MDTHIEDTSDRRSQAIKGAFDALMKHGLGNLSLDHVASQAGMSRQLLRYHFPDQDDLMIAVCDYLAQLYREPLIEIASTREGPERINIFLDFYFDLLADKPKPRDDQAYDAMFALAARVEPVRNALAEQYGLLGHVLSHEFIVQYPELDQQSASELSFLFVSLMYGHWKLVASLGYAEAHKVVTRKAMDRLINSYVDSPANWPEVPRIWSRG